MGRISKVVFGRTKLPEKCLVYAGVYPSRTVDSAKGNFDSSSRTKEDFVKYAFARKKGKEFLLCFGLLGAASTLELLQCLKDGGTKDVVFIGSMGAKSLPIGTIVLPIAMIDKAGIVSLDEPAKSTINANSRSLAVLRRLLRANRVEYVEATIVSVPSVFHGVKSITTFVRERREVDGVEMELSTLFHFASKLGIKAYAIVYVYDNTEHDIMHRSKSVDQARRQAYETTQRIGLEVLLTDTSRA
jgi:purine-nucleoside phosphorylase